MTKLTLVILLLTISTSYINAIFRHTCPRDKPNIKTDGFAGRFLSRFATCRMRQRYEPDLLKNISNCDEQNERKRFYKCMSGESLITHNILHECSDNVKETLICHNKRGGEMAGLKKMLDCARSEIEALKNVF